MGWDVRVFIFCQLPDADSVTEGACSKQGVYNSLQTVTHRTLTLTTSIGQAVLEKTQPKAEFINQNEQVISPNIKVAPTQGNNYCKKHTRLFGKETARELCERQGGCPGNPIPNKPDGFHGHKATLKHRRVSKDSN